MTGITKEIAASRETPATPAMTVEALAKLRDLVAGAHSDARAKITLIAAAVLEAALADAERRATEAEGQQPPADWRELYLWAKGQLAKAQSRLAAVEAAHETTAAGYHRLLLLHRETADALSAVEARCGLMREALEPFAEFSLDADENDGCADEADDVVMVTGVNWMLTNGDLRRARSILAYPGGKSDQGEKEQA